MKRAERMINTEFFTYYNVNPKDKIGGDCVIRAIALACDQSWETTVREMTELGIKMGYVLNDPHVYEKYLLLKGFKACKEPRDVCNRKMTFKEWVIEEQVSDWNYKSIVANIGSHHVVCIKNEKVHDIWNSSHSTMHKYWIR